VANTQAGSGHSASHHPAVGISVPSKNPGRLEAIVKVSNGGAAVILAYYVPSKTYFEAPQRPCGGVMPVVGFVSSRSLDGSWPLGDSPRTPAVAALSSVQGGETQHCVPIPQLEYPVLRKRSLRSSPRQPQRRDDRNAKEADGQETDQEAGITHD